VGNGSVTSASRPYDHSDSVLELGPDLQLVQYFAPSSWASDNAADLDLSMAPALLPDGQVLIAGKAGIAYLLDGSRLGGIGGERASLGSVCPDDVDGGSAEVGTVVYLPCLAGIVAVRAARAPPALRLVWSSGVGGGPPIVAGGLVWTVGQDGTLFGLDPTTGAVRRRAPVGVPANHFPTPGVGDGLLLVSGAQRVMAFATSSTAAPTTTPTTGRPASRPAVAANGRALSAWAVVGIVVAGLVLLGGTVGLVAWRRRRRPHADG
jgi:hypothetical protein